MKPALLVIVMDFLVSSLLLYVSGPGLPALPAARPRPVVAQAEASAEPFMPPPAFPDAATELAAARLAAQAQDLEALSSAARASEANRAELSARLTGRESELTAAQSALSGLQREYAQQQEELRRVQEARTALASAHGQLATQHVTTARQLAESLSRQQALSEQDRVMRARIAQQEQTIQQQAQTLAEQQAALRRELRSLAEGQQRIGATAEDIRRDQLAMRSDLAAGREALGAQIGGVQTQQLALARDVTQVTNALAQSAARQAGPYARFRDARATLEVALEARRTGRTAEEARPYAATTRLNAPVLAAADGLWMAAVVDTLGLNWPSDYTLDAIRIRAVAGADGKAIEMPGPLRSDAREPRIMLLPLPPGAAWPGVTPVTLPGKAGLERRGFRDIFLFKRSSEGLGAPVEVSPDLSHPDIVVIRKTYRGWVSFLTRNLFVSSDALPESGDCLVTAEGELVGIMLDDTRGRILSSDDFQSSGRAFSLASPGAFGADFRAWRSGLR